MKIKVERYKYPIKWDDLPVTEIIYNLDDQNTKEQYIKDMQNIKDDELLSVQTDIDKTEENKLF